MQANLVSDASKNTACDALTDVLSAGVGEPGERERLFDAARKRIGGERMSTSIDPEFCLLCEEGGGVSKGSMAHPFLYYFKPTTEWITFLIWKVTSIKSPDSSAGLDCLGNETHFQ